MAEKTGNSEIDELLKKIFDGLDELARDIKDKDNKEKIDSLKSVFKDIGSLEQKVTNSPFAQCNIENSTITLNTGKRTSSVSITDKTVLELIKLIKKFVNKVNKKTVKISDKNIKKIADKITESMGDIVNKNYNQVINKFEKNIMQVLDAISDIETGDTNTIIDSFNNIFDNSKKIFNNIGDTINNNIDNVNQVVNEINKNVNDYSTDIQKQVKKEIGNLSVQINEIETNINNININITKKLDEHRKYLEDILDILKELKPIIIEIRKLLNKCLEGECDEGKLDEILAALRRIEEITKLTEGKVNTIKELISSHVIPVLEDISTKIGDIASKLPEMNETIDEILRIVRDNNNLIRGLVTKQEFNERIDKLEKLIQDILIALPGPRSDDQETPNKRFQLIWVLVKDKSVAEKIKEKEVMPKEKNYISLNQGNITVNLNEHNSHRFAGRIAENLVQKNFDIEKVYICLGARVLGTENPCRWDIRHLKTDYPDIYRTLKTIITQLEQGEKVKIVIKALKKDIKHDKNKSTTLLWADKKDLKDVLERIGEVDAYVRPRLDNYKLGIWNPNLSWLLIALKRKSEKEYDKLKSKFDNEFIKRVDNANVQEDNVKTELENRGTKNTLEELEKVLINLEK